MLGPGGDVMVTFFSIPDTFQEGKFTNSQSASLRLLFFLDRFVRLR